LNEAILLSVRDIGIALRIRRIRLKIAKESDIKDTVRKKLHFQFQFLRLDLFPKVLTARFIPTRVSTYDLSWWRYVDISYRVRRNLYEYLEMNEL